LQASDKKLKIAGSSLLGVFARATEKVVLLPLEVAPEDLKALQEGLKVDAVSLLAAGSAVVGSLISANSFGFVITHHATDEEISILREHGRVARLPSKINAAGNVILTNDHAALVHPGLSARACETVAKTLGVKVVRGTIGGLKTVGMAGVATNKGLLAASARLSRGDRSPGEALRAASGCGHSQPRLAAGGIRPAGQQQRILCRHGDLGTGAGSH